MSKSIAQWFHRLSLVEFSNLELGQSGSGSIDWGDVRKIVSLMNEGLLSLHTRYLLKEKIILLEQIAHRSDYPLVSSYADSQWAGGSHPPPHIKDSPTEPYRDDLLKVLKVVNENREIYPLNEDKNPYSLFLPQHNVLRIPTPEDGKLLMIHYQAKHPELIVSDTLMLTDLDQQIELPDVLDIAFMHYLSHRLYGAMNTEVSINRSREYYQMFEEECRKAFEQDTVKSSRINTPEDKFTSRGWI